MKIGSSKDFILLRKWSLVSKTTFLVFGKCNSIWIGVSYCSESGIQYRKPLSYCSESAVRFGLGFLSARKVEFSIENHFLIARKVQFGLDWGFLVLGKWNSVS